MQALQQTGLDSLPVGATASVLRIDGGDDLATRLADLGFWPGTAVTVLRRAPLGDPTVYRLRGFRLALRRGEAARVVMTAPPE